jgi:hypothetical protein
MIIAEKTFKNSAVNFVSWVNGVGYTRSFNMHNTHIKDCNTPPHRSRSVPLCLCQQAIFSSLEDEFPVLIPRLTVDS